MRPGTIVYLTQGEYSSYKVLGVFVVVREFDPVEMGKRHSQYEQDCYRSRTYLGNPRWLNFAAWMLQEGYVAEIAAEEVHSDAS